MDKYIYDNSNGLWYELQGDYYIPCLVLPTEKEERHIGIWGHRYLWYIREHKKVLYTDLLISGKLQSYLADVEEQAQELFDHLVKQRAEHEGITEKLKSERPHVVGRQNERTAVSGYGNGKYGGNLRMRRQKYYFYLTAEERRNIFNALLSCHNKRIA